jgi:hypothetical protein
MNSRQQEVFGGKARKKKINENFFFAFQQPNLKAMEQVSLAAQQQLSAARGNLEQVAQVIAQSRNTVVGLPHGHHFAHATESDLLSITANEALSHQQELKAEELKEVLSSGDNDTLHSPGTPGTPNSRQLAELLFDAFFRVDFSAGATIQKEVAWIIAYHILGDDWQRVQAWFGRVRTKFIISMDKFYYN